MVQRSIVLYAFLTLISAQLHLRQHHNVGKCCLLTYAGSSHTSRLFFVNSRYVANLLNLTKANSTAVLYLKKTGVTNETTTFPGMEFNIKHVLITSPQWEELNPCRGVRRLATCFVLSLYEMKMALALFLKTKLKDVCKKGK